MRILLERIIIVLLPIFVCGTLVEAEENASVSADPLPQHSPRVCVGYRSDGLKGVEEGDQQWGSGVRGHRNCPPNWAVFGGKVEVAPWDISVASLPLRIQCCPLPASDILAAETVLASSECPEGYLVSGATLYDDDCPKCPRPLRCTKVNSQRYQLGQKTPGAYWGFGMAFWHSPVRFFKSEIPVAIRYALGRLSRFEWDIQGCVGFPFGSLLVFKRQRWGCDNTEFQQLQYRGLPGDPPQGTPVVMFPECRAISSYFDPEARCLPKN